MPDTARTSEQIYASIKQSLIEKGYDAAVADVLVRAWKQAVLRTAGQFNMLAGVLFSMAGIVVTWLSYVLAEAIGSRTFLVAWGMVVFGIFLFFRGLFQFLRASIQAR